MQAITRLPSLVLVLAIVAGMALVAWALLAGSAWAIFAGTAGLIFGIKSAILLARRAGVTDQPQ